jgi:glycosyltransferase involved in cell wall biosynthesis
MSDPANALRPVSIVTVAYDGYFFARLLVEKIREFIGPREYEIIVVDRGSRDGTREWLEAQGDVRVIRRRQWRARHGHGESAALGIKKARHEIIVLMDSDAHPVSPHWLECTADRLGERCRLAGPRFNGLHKGNPYGWFIHPHFMVFYKADMGGRVLLEKVRGHDTDTGEEATIRLLDAGYEVLAHPIERCPEFSVGHPHYPSVSAGVFHAWYVTRLAREADAVARETNGAVTRENYLEPLCRQLRAAYRLDY